MTHLNQLAPHTTTAGRPRAARPAHASAREARTRRSFDGVLASYVRELSTASHTTSSQRAGRRTI
jgi:hypothetical protein